VINATIQLTQLIANTLSGGEKSAWPLTVQALGTGMPSEIFVYQIVPPTNQLPGDRYQCVASVSQLSELPLLAGPDTNKAPAKPKLTAKYTKLKNFDIPFYRSASAEFICHTACEAQDLWNMIQCDVQRLVDNFNACQNLVNSPTYPANAPVLLPMFRLYPINGQVVGQLLDPSKNLYHTMMVFNDGGVLTLQISDQGYDPVFSSSGVSPISTPGLPPLFRMYAVGGDNVPQLLDTSTGLYHTVKLLNDDGVLTGQLSDQGY
jgi:hypothetical protein